MITFDHLGHLVSEVPKLLIDERALNLRDQERRHEARVDHCVLCDTLGGLTVRCDLCLDRAHVFCLCAFALGLSEGFEWIGTRCPQITDCRDILNVDSDGRLMFSHLYHAAQAQSTALITGKSNSSTFLCPACESARLSRDLVECVYCGSDRFQTALIKCRSPRCSRGIHPFCAAILDQAMYGDVVDETIFVEDGKEVHKEYLVRGLAEKMRDPATSNDTIGRCVGQTFDRCNRICHSLEEQGGYYCPECTTTRAVDGNFKEDVEGVYPNALFFYQDDLSSTEIKRLEMCMKSERDSVRNEGWARQWIAGDNFEINDNQITWSPPSDYLDRQTSFRESALLAGVDIDGPAKNDLGAFSFAACSTWHRRTKVTPEERRDTIELAQSRNLKPTEAGIERCRDLQKIVREVFKNPPEESIPPRRLLPIFTDDIKYKKPKKGKPVVSSKTLREEGFIFPGVQDVSLQPSKTNDRKPLVYQEFLDSSPEGHTDVSEDEDVYFREPPFQPTRPALKRGRSAKLTKTRAKAKAKEKEVSKAPARRIPAWPSAKGRSTQSFINYLDHYFNFELLQRYVFTALAAQYDELSISDLSEPVRILFIEHRDPQSPMELFPVKAADPTTTDVSRTITSFPPPQSPAPGRDALSGWCRFERMREIDSKQQHYGNPLCLPFLMRALVLLYERLEEIYGRGRYRELAKSPHSNPHDFGLPASWMELLDVHSNCIKVWKGKGHLADIQDGARCCLRTLRDAVVVLDDEDRMFNDDLIYHPLVARTHNSSVDCVRFEKDEVTFRIFKVFSRFGFLPPIVLDNNPRLGVFVRAARNIPSHTVMGEYVGMVEPQRWNISKILQTSDSVYDIDTKHNSRSSLCIVPEPYTNFIRYIAGINNTRQSDLEKRNVDAAAFVIGQEVRLFVSSLKEIKQGQIFYLNYNAGVEPLYPTEDFE